jgi:hypothetical protein
MHMDALGSNAVICAIHAEDEDLAELREAVEAKALADMNDEKTTVLVDHAVTAPSGQDDEDGRSAAPTEDIITFAKWTHPIHPSEDCTPPAWNLPRSTDRDILRLWIEEVERVEAKIIGNTPRNGQSPAVAAHLMLSRLLHKLICYS